MKANFLLPGLIAPLLVVACASKAPIPVPPPPRVIQNPGLPEPRPQTPPISTKPNPTVSWLDQTVMAGNWSWRREGGLSTARFALPTGQLRLSLICDAARRVVTLRQEGSVGGDEPMTVTTTTTRRILVGRASSQPPYGIQAELAADDRLLDAIAFSRGRFMIELPARIPDIVPTQPELSRVIEDCR